MRIASVILTSSSFVVAYGLFAAPRDLPWTLFSAQGQIQLTSLPNGGLSFAFPVSPNPDPNATGDWAQYLIKYAPAPLALGGNMTMTLTLSTSRAPLFNFMSAVNNTCATPASVRLYFQTGKLWNSSNYTRWWSNSHTGPLDPAIAYKLGAGTVTLTVPLTPGHWSETYGRFGDSSTAASSGFSKALSVPTYIGMTFGGGCFFGHGVNVSAGTAQFDLTNFSTF